MISLIDIFLKIIDIMVYIGFDDFFIFNKDVLQKKKNIEYASDSIEQPISFSIKNEVFDILESLPSGMKTLLEQRFFHNMTMTEIADENGYSRETARRRLKKAIRMCKNLVKS